MTNPNYQEMSNQDLREYLSRRKDENKQVITTIEDPDFDEKIRKSIQAQIDEYKNKMK